MLPSQERSNKKSESLTHQQLRIVNHPIEKNRNQVSDVYIYILFFFHHGAFSNFDSLFGLI